MHPMISVVAAAIQNVTPFDAEKLVLHVFRFHIGTYHGYKAKAYLKHDISERTHF